MSVFLEKTHSKGDIGSGIISYLSLDGEEALIADFIQRFQVVGEIHISLAQRQFDVRAVLKHLRFYHAVKNLRVNIMEPATVLGVGVHNVVFQGIDGLDRVVSRDHHKVGGV